MSRACIVLVLLVISPLHTSAHAQDARGAFFSTLRDLCGARFEGAKTFPDDPNDAFAGKLLVAEVVSCSDTVVRVPFLVGEDRSRTWVFRRGANSLQLQHDHRHEDGTPDEVNLYGGMATATGTARSQSFPADAHTARLIPAAVTNVWTVSLNANASVLTYHLERDGRPRFNAELRRVPRGASAATPAQSSAVDSIFRAFTRPGSPGCIVGVNRSGVPLLRRAYGLADIERGIPLAPGMPSEIGSVSKQFTASALLLLVQDGRLSLDDDVRKHWPTFPDFGQKVTVRHLLNHTSGVRDQFGLLDLVGRPSGEVVHTVREVVNLLERQRTLNFPVNTEYLYSNTGYTFANLLVERLSGQPFTVFTTERLFKPLGLRHAEWRRDFRHLVPGRVLAYRAAPPGAGQWEMDFPFSELHGSGGLLLTIDEMIAWTEALHAGAVGRPGFLAELTRSGRLERGTETGYALGLSVGDWRGVRVVSHTGSTAGYRAFLAHYPESGHTVALQCNTGTANSVALGQGVSALFLGDRLKAAVAADAVDLAGAPAAGSAATTPVARPAPDRAFFARLVGRYHDAETGATVELAMEDSVVVMRFPPARSVRLRLVAADSLMGPGRAIRVRRDAAGVPVGFTYHAGRVRNIRFDRVR